MYIIACPLKAEKGSSDFVVAVLFTAPFIGGDHLFGAQFVALRSAHAGLGLVAGAVLFFIGVELSDGPPSLVYFMICLVTTGSYAPLGPFWPMSVGKAPMRMAGSATGLIDA